MDEGIRRRERIREVKVRDFARYFCSFSLIGRGRETTVDYLKFLYTAHLY